VDQALQKFLCLPVLHETSQLSIVVSISIGSIVNQALFNVIVFRYSGVQRRFAVSTTNLCAFVISSLMFCLFVCLFRSCSLFCRILAIKDDYLLANLCWHRRKWDVGWPDWVMGRLVEACMLIRACLKINSDVKYSIFVAYLPHFRLIPIVSHIRHES